MSQILQLVNILKNSFIFFSNAEGVKLWIVWRENANMWAGCCKIRCPISKISTSLGDLVLAALSIFCSNLQHFHLKFSTSLQNFQSEKLYILFVLRPHKNPFLEAAVCVKRSLLPFLLLYRRFSRRFFLQYH